MSTINTNPLNPNYPVPGVNNNSQGFRDNFQNIKVNLDIAANEITDLQNKAVLKTALANTAGAINNDMANTLISNASTRGFRSTSYNLGNALSGTVLVNASLADVFYGNVSNNIQLQFSSWAPTQTQQVIYLQLGRDTTANTNYNINFPPESSFTDNDHGITIVQNYSANGNINFPNEVNQLNFAISTVDCGNTIYITPTNRPFQTSQIVNRIPPTTGELGDTVGTVCVSPASTQLTISNTEVSTDLLTTSSTSSLYAGLEVNFTGSTFGGVSDSTTYYVRNVVSNTTFTLSTTTSLASNVTLSTASGNMYLNPVSYLYIAVDNYSATVTNLSIDATVAPATITANIPVGSTYLNQPIMFTGVEENDDIGVQANTHYYIKSITGSNITISQTRYNGIAGPEYQDILSVTPNITTNVTTPDMTLYLGPDIFRRTKLDPW
jgi:hypothetical protein